MNGEGAAARAGGSGSGSGSAVQHEAPVGPLSEYLCAVVPLLLGGTAADLTAALRRAHDPLVLFCEDSQATVLAISRAVAQDEGGEDADDRQTSAAVVYEIAVGANFRNAKQAVVFFVKRSAVLVNPTEKPMVDQLRVLTLPDGHPYGSMHTVVRSVVRPFLESAMDTTSIHDKLGIRGLRKSLGDLELSLQHLQQDVEIPHITLVPHPLVKEVVDKALAAKRKADVQDFGSKAEDPNFLNALQKTMTRWTREIQKVTLLERDPSTGTATQEVSFWINLHYALNHIKEERENPYVNITLELLKHARRFHVTVSFDSDTGLKKALEKVENYLQLMKDFPIKQLLQATDMDALRNAVVNIFGHFRRIRKTQYPVSRAQKFEQAISRDLRERLLSLLAERNLLDMTFAEFTRVMTACTSVFHHWNTEFDKQYNILKDHAKNSPDNDKGVRRVQPEHKILVDRLHELEKFRQHHEQLRTVIMRVLQPASQGSNEALDAEDAFAVSEVNSAYDAVRSVDPLELSSSGTNAWRAAIEQYEERISRVEKRIATRMRDQLGAAKTADDMFRVLSRFSVLFSRPSIRNGIQDYQTPLIARVLEELERLQRTYEVEYENTLNSKMSLVRDIPPVSGQIVWARQIEHQVKSLLKRVEDVLGTGWEKTAEGDKLQKMGASLVERVNPQPTFQHWLNEMMNRDLNIQGNVFRIGKDASRGLSLEVSFQPDAIHLNKEVRNLRALGYRVPLALVNKAINASHLYPYCISLRASLRTYDQTLTKLKNRDNLVPLIAKYHLELQTFLANQGFPLQWNSYKLEKLVQELSDLVSNFQGKVNSMIAADERISELLKSLETCTYDAKTFQRLMEQIQHNVDELNLHNYVNMGKWVAMLDAEVEARLISRLEKALNNWTTALERCGTEKSTAVLARDYVPDQDKSDLPKIESMTLEILIHNQTMMLNPPPEAARERLLGQLQRYLGVIVGLPRVQQSRYNIDGSTELRSQTTYANLLVKLPASSASLLRAYEVISGKLEEIHEYVRVWLQYQALWDTETESIVSRLGDNLSLWNDLLTDIKRARRTFDTSETTKVIGPVRIDYGQVQARVNMKYDALHREMLSRFGGMMNSHMKNFFATMQKSRNKLETLSIDGVSTAEAVHYITTVQDMKRKMRGWAEEVESFSTGLKILERQRYNFGDDWLSMEQLQAEWDAFNDICVRKDLNVQGQLSTLQMKVINEDRQMESRLLSLLDDWERNKPVSGDVRPDAAINTLAIYESRFLKLKEEYDALTEAKRAMDLPTKDDDRLRGRLEELGDLKSSWAELSRIWNHINDLRQLPWTAVVPRKIRAALEDVINQLKNLPQRVRSYAAYEHTMQSVKAHLKDNTHVANLKSDALKERHWKQLTRELRARWVFAELTLGDVWDVDLDKNEKVIKAVLLQAQGELGLEEFLKTIKEEWATFELDLVDYQHKTYLIRGWDDLFTLLKEHINSLEAMRLSPYFRVFEEEANSWHDKLSRLFAMYDVWMDVQRRWVDLEGVFTGSADIKHLLPNESSRFQTISTEFLGMMNRVKASRVALEVLNIPDGQKVLERLADLLGKIQKALTDYLEQERNAFPRFYFVGDDDLLEIIGNSKNVDRVQKHFRKMFAGLHSVSLGDEGGRIDVLLSKEGERVPLTTPVVCRDVKINLWLTALEDSMRDALARSLALAVGELQGLQERGFNLEPYKKWLDTFQAQLVVVAAQVAWSESVEAALRSGGNTAPALSKSASLVEEILSGLADTVLQYQPPVLRRKLEHMITELVHQRDVTRELQQQSVSSAEAFNWLQVMRFYFNPRETNVLKQLTIRMANTQNYYGFEYLGLTDKLVQTPLTDRCFLTMTQALDMRQGGSPFGPAGTGKTESVKALGCALSRFTLVFNCDETFDFFAMGRIFVGLCQVGAWGCFDEFNRLEERMLSAVSQQIQTIQLALKAALPGQKSQAELLGRSVPVRPDMAIFITMNPGYAGRSNLPDNLKKLFRPLAMTKPDGQLIAQVMLYSQGFRTAEALSKKIVPLFTLCAEQLSAQSHYDFGLRSLKAVLVSAGNIKRQHLESLRDAAANSKSPATADLARNIDEQEVLIQSVVQTMVPKLVADDIPLLNSLLADVFPGVKPPELPLEALRKQIEAVCAERCLVVSELFMTKILQVYQVSCLQHGLMLVGPSGSGKSAAWTVLLEALRRLEKKEGQAHVLDPKAISKDALYGTLDPTTREWTDGLFTHIIRKIYDNQRGEQDQRQWVVFDGDVDPEWVENLNSVLDDNKLLTLPNGERMALPPCIRIMFEVQDLKHATLATVSRCGMVWFSEDVLTLDMYFERYLRMLRSEVLEGMAAEAATPASRQALLELQSQVADLLAPFLAPEGLVARAVAWCRDRFHVMEFTKMRAVSSLLCMLNQIVRNVITYNNAHEDFPISATQLRDYTQKRLIFTLLWSLVGDSRSTVRAQMSEWLRQELGTKIALPPQGDIMDYEVTLPQGGWSAWADKVPRKEIDAKKVTGTDEVVPTLDTVRHENVLYAWLSEHLPMVLCGPPGSGKTMTLFAALRALPHFEVAGLNFSSSTTPELLLKTFDQYCEYRRTPRGVVLAPTQPSKWLVVFMDECNLPKQDKYATVRVITFIRQLVERGGFWRTSDHTWVRLERIQFVGACNPPTDPGRTPLDLRFLRHVPVVYVDYPGPESLKQIYGTFNRAMLTMQPNLRNQADALTEAMVDFFTQTSKRFTADMQPHYIYSPREMTRWVKGIAEAIEPLEFLDVDGLVRLWAHEALRLFQDRLVYDEERQWTDEKIDEVARAHFHGANFAEALKRPILYSNWLSRHYMPVAQDELRAHVQARLKVFYEEELDVPLVLFDEVLDHVLRIDRVFRQNQGHVLMIGMSGAGKTTLSRFVAWMNGLSVFQVKVHRQYGPEAFDEDLRNVLRRSGTQDEKIVFIMDEGNVMDTAFLERMNTLLANGEVPGLFEGDEYSALMTLCKEGAQRKGLVLEGNDELYKWFSNQVMNNLHVVFTMNPAEGGLQDRAATSPALFNRCVLNWFGDWSDTAVYQVGLELTQSLDLERPDYRRPAEFPAQIPQERLPSIIDHRAAVMNACVFVHKATRAAARRLLKREGRSTAVTPRHFLEFVNQLSSLYAEKRGDLEEQQLHLNIGLQKIEQTFKAVEDEQVKMGQDEIKLRAMNVRANEKMREVMLSTEKTQRKQEESAVLEAELVVKQGRVAENRTKVESELAGVEPAVREAQESVQSIEKKHLQELKALNNPPSAVKLALESVLCMLGERTTDWKVIRSYITRDDFITTILNFDPDRVTPKIRDEMERNYLSNPDYSFEKAWHASRAAGPLVKWASAMVNYAIMLLKIEPLRNELKRLAAEADEVAGRHGEVQKLLKTLEATLKSLTEEYNTLQKDIGKTEDELVRTKAKVERSVKLLDSLKDERERWSKGSEDFAAQMDTIVGDTFLASAFLAYAGYFDQSYRGALFSQWQRHLKAAGVVFKPALSIQEYLSTPDERLQWRANGLPDDELCTENAVMLKRTKRYALVIDPAGQAVGYIMQQMASTKITKTSFLDKGFRKSLESSLRFGTPLLVQDAEAYDPLLNPVLNKEVKRTGGRVLVTLGQDDGIDLSPAFNIILTTRNPAHQFPPDLCSRVTLINFTVTRGSLMSQCLNQVLRSERPDVEKKRGEQLKLQGAFRAQLRRLEKALLQSLNEVKGSILEDDKILGALEVLKGEAAEVASKVAESDTVMAEITAVTAVYQPLAQKCSAVYFTLEQLSSLHFLYFYSLSFFLDIFSAVLAGIEGHLKDVKDYGERLNIITRDLFVETYSRVSPGLLHEHRISLAITLARFYLMATPDALDEDEYRAFLAAGGAAAALSVGSEAAAAKGPLAPLVDAGVLRPVQAVAAVNLAGAVPAWAGLAQLSRSEGKTLADWLAQPRPEENELDLPGVEAADGTPATTAAQLFRKLLVVQALRPDRVLAMCHEIVRATFGSRFAASAGEGSEALTQAVVKAIAPSTPLMLCGVRGFDPSSKVRDLALICNVQLAEVAIGSAEGFLDADRAIADASKTGKWVVLKNVHLATGWLVELEKKLNTLTPHANFRLFLTTEINPKLPVTLLRSSRVFVYEAAAGVKASLLRALNSVPKDSMVREPAERSRVHLLLCWVHAVIVERLRYAPLGWSKRYEFGEADLRTAIDTADTWIDLIAKGRSHIDPAKLPWEALRTLLVASIYGARIDNDTDQRLLQSFVASIFRAESFDESFAFVEADKASGTLAIHAPEGTKREQFLQWADTLPDVQSPAWLGLPSNAELVLLTNRAIALALNMQKLQTTDEEEDQLPDNVDADAASAATPAWMRAVKASAQDWLAVLPDSLPMLKRNPDKIRDPLFRFFDREVGIGSKLLKVVRRDLEDVIKACNGEIKQTNYLRSLMVDYLNKGLVFDGWRHYKVPKDLSVTAWIADFARRVQQLDRIRQLADSGHAPSSAKVWIGGLFVPEAYITATRQAVAQAHNWALEKLVLTLDVRKEAADTPKMLDDQSFLLMDLRLDGAKALGRSLELSSAPFVILPLTVLKWVYRETDTTAAVVEEGVTLPVYLNATRSEVIFTCQMQPPAGVSANVIYGRGVAMACSSLSGLV